ncbi:MAG: hypothetical protein QXQ94_10850 [Candidatus Bathyarchaeia archaeon]
MKEVRVIINDKEWAFIEKAKAVIPKEWGNFEQFLIRTGIIGFIKYLMTGAVFESEENDIFWHRISVAILEGYEEWLDLIKISAPPRGLYG